MDEQVWRRMTPVLQRIVRKMGRAPRMRFSDFLIVSMYLWSVLYGRPMCWACDKSHYNTLFRPRRLPSVSQLSRRIRSARCQRILQELHEQIAGQATQVSFIDAKPLIVSPVSADPQAARGHISGGFAKGYKLHALATQDRRIPRWSVMPLNQGESPVACAMMRGAPRFPAQSLVLADSSYDGRELYDVLAGKDASLIAQLRGIGTHPVTVRQAGPIRREAIACWQQVPGLTRYVYKERFSGMEGTFGNLTSYGGGLGPLPAWVRGLERVRRWVGAKIILYNARVRIRNERRNAA
jgi:hypothetical protein